MVFKKFDGSTIDLVEYVKQYLKDHEGIELMVGCDSQNKGKYTHYAIVVVMYRLGHGGHVIYRKWNTPRERVRSVRLINEVWFALETAEELKNNGLPKAQWIDLDINPNPSYGSNEVFKQATGMCEGMGYKYRFKTIGPLVTTMADSVVRS